MDDESQLRSGAITQMRPLTTTGAAGASAVVAADATAHRPK